jgi:hypothetical protein
MISRLLMNLSAGGRPANPAGTAAFAVECGSLATSESIILLILQDIDHTTLQQRKVLA